MAKAKTTRLTKGQRELQRKRAGWEFNLQLYNFLDSFKSKEEPTVKFSFGEKVSMLSKIVSANIDKLETKKAWQR